ncbi:MAG TPA: hypothetical protein VFL66_05895 [Gaiellaceae bacterium]|nr:hypothetical protein [Gaiellaceae bacterium]
MERIRIEIGFEGGQVMSAVVGIDAAQQLEQALERGEEGAFAFDAEDGRYSVVLRRVDYLKRFLREARVGFGAQAAE